MTVTSFLVSKVAFATGIAVVAEVVRRRSRRVEVAYTVWAMVLVVLLVPPVFIVPLPAWISANLESLSIDWLWFRGASANSTIQSGDKEALSAISGALAQYLPFAAVPIWLVGGSLVLWRHAWHVRLVERLVRFATPASPEVLEQRTDIARELGIHIFPTVVTADGAFSPFLWHPLRGQPCVVLPLRLLESLSPESIGAILRHELIHLRRRDAWRHLVEQLVLMLWWWLPITWIARRRLRELEELCTDAEVLRSNPQGAKAYGHALLSTEAFLSHSRANRLGVVLAFTSPGSLKTRITAIARFAPSRVAPPSHLPTYGLVAVSVALGLSVAGSVSNRHNTAPLAQTIAASIDAPTVYSQPPTLPHADHADLERRGPPDTASVTVRHTEHEIVLSWPGESPLAAMHVIRLVKVSTADVWPPLWRIDGDQFDMPISARYHSHELEWIFTFLGAHDVVVDEDGTRHSHSGTIDVSAA
jgi:beta-lactamase regulating signal transducer with metallopeptidase domain